MQVKTFQAPPSQPTQPMPMAMPYNPYGFAYGWGAMPVSMRPNFPLTGAPGRANPISIAPGISLNVPAASSPTPESSEAKADTYTSESQASAQAAQPPLDPIDPNLPPEEAKIELAGDAVKQFVQDTLAKNPNLLAKISKSDLEDLKSGDPEKIQATVMRILNDQMPQFVQSYLPQVLEWNQRLNQSRILRLFVHHLVQPIVSKAMPPQLKFAVDYLFSPSLSQSSTKDS